MKFRKLLFTLILSLSLLMPNLGISANNDLTETTDLDISKTLENREQKHEHNIVFNLPSSAIVEPIDIDIVFVMDTTSISSYRTVRTAINNLLDRLVVNPALNINIGVVKFAVNVTKTTQTLAELNSGNLEAIKERFSQSYSTGSNMYGGILAGRDLLATGTAENENKYLIMASDFGGYKSDTGNGTGLSFFYKIGYGNIGYEALHNNINGRDFGPRYRGKPASFFTVDKVEELLRNKVFFSGVSVSAETDKYLTKFGMEAGEFKDSLRFGFPALTDEEKEFLIPTFNFTTRDDFPTAFEKNIYQSGHQFLELKEEGVNVIAITTPYQDGLESWQIPFNAASNAFKDWFELNIGKRYETTRNESFINMLDDIESELVYLVGKGSITDVVDSRFEVIKDSAQVLLNGSPLVATEISPNVIGFGTDTNGIYQFVYNYNNVSGKEIVTWDINKEIAIDDFVQFKFGVKLKELPSTSGLHTLETNESAKIDYLSSLEVNKGITDYTKTQSMPSPTVQVEMAEVISKYIDENGNSLEADEVFLSEVGSPFTTKSKMIDGYQLSSVDGIETGNLLSGTQVVNYIYTKVEDTIKVGQVIVKYLDENGKEIADQETFSGEVGSSFGTTEKVIPGYTFKVVEGIRSGLLKEGTTLVTYRYTKDVDPVQTGEVKVNYRDKDGKDLLDSVTLNGIVGEAYTTTLKAIEGYNFLRIVGNTTGSFSNGLIEITYVYEQSQKPEVTGQVTVYYRDEKGNTIRADSNLFGTVGTTYNVKAAEIDGYKLI